MPFLGLAIVEALSGERTDVADPTLAIFEAQQPGPETTAFQLARVDRLARVFAA